MAAHILQVAYYDTLQEIRAKMLEAAGYQVTSVLGNDNAMWLNGAVIATADLVVVGFSTPHSVRGGDGSLVQSALPQDSGHRLAVLRLGEVPGGRRSYLV